ncbi:MAG: Rrf2 family transcriptional regulator [Candidatus Hydrogenedentota bacterium]|uniref:Rrf2 family transcriptional regulator n=1 Tax=Sumerlaea chitinivorans TaxID=2250252 RepID=A0A2Z4Y125_SUMC1|nr:Rrf2 family transcriptional regulator [Candidatus Sumerlaea chitinivorans]MCX7963053.1 Rrf2 family transcriptional regulator [Candidatus Sumerlaea chitinivorans]RMH30709.1 MAG: Rrf2 family transcriptional regulator [Candidatus Hydrogenedentota bacterium]GIX44747.1 MAG: hypothetical protein KatS3mg130_1155 [Candidatus Sumerlaea sp.]
MLALNQTTAYAILTLGLLNGPGGEPRRVHELAAASGIPRPYLAKLVHRLRLLGFVTTQRGYRGGVCLARPASEIRLIEVAEAVSGRPFSAPCLLGLRVCNDPRACPLNRFWSKTIELVRTGLSRATLLDANGLHCVAAARAGKYIPSAASPKSPNTPRSPTNDAAKTILKLRERRTE